MRGGAICGVSLRTCEVQADDVDEHDHSGHEDAQPVDVEVTAPHAAGCCWPWGSSPCHARRAGRHTCGRGGLEVLWWPCRRCRGGRGTLLGLVCAVKDARQLVRSLRAASAGGSPSARPFRWPAAVGMAQCRANADMCSPPAACLRVAMALRTASIGPTSMRCSGVRARA
jgi:hypothetical protein